jgi:hypothetical protein
MDVAEKARANAISLELKKDGLQQRQSGDWQLRFTVSSIDMDQRLAAASMGTRYAAVLVEINDDETPVDHQAERRDQWRDLGPAKQAGIRCKEPIFWAWMMEHLHYRNVASEEVAASIVRDILCVDSRADLASPGYGDARTRWYELDNAFQAWKVKEHG